MFGTNVLFLESIDKKELDEWRISDENLFVERGEAVLHCKIPYKDFYLPTGPLMPYLYCFAPLMAMLTPIPVTYWFRFLFSFFNALTAWTIYQGFKTEGNEYEKWGYKAGYLYGLNPVIIFMALLWGTDETILAAFFALAAWQIKRKSWFWTSFFIIICACAKYFSIFLLPFLLFTRPKIIEGIMVLILNCLIILGTYISFFFIAEEETLVQFERFLFEAPLEKIEDQGIWCFLEADGYFNIRIIPFPFYQILIIGLPLFLALWMVMSKRDNFTRMGAPGLLFTLLYSKFQISYLLIGLWSLIGSIKIRERRIIPSVFLIIIPIILYGTVYLLFQDLRVNFILGFYFILISCYLILLGLVLWKIFAKNVGFNEQIIND
jgi:hypothetical protein